jgi:hypothetical protein
MHKIVFACELVKNVVVLAAFALAFSNSRNFNKCFENIEINILLIVFSYIWLISIAFLTQTVIHFFSASVSFSDKVQNIFTILAMSLLVYSVVYVVIKFVEKASATLILWNMFIACLTTNYVSINTGWTNAIVSEHFPNAFFSCKIGTF